MNGQVYRWLNCRRRIGISSRNLRHFSVMQRTHDLKVKFGITAQSLFVLLHATRLIYTVGLASAWYSIVNLSTLLKKFHIRSGWC